MPGGWFTCARCGKRHEKLWTDEEARDEMKATWKHVTRDMAVICDECYADFTSWVKEHHPEWLK